MAIAVFSVVAGYIGRLALMKSAEDNAQNRMTNTYRNSKRKAA